METKMYGKLLRFENSGKEELCEELELSFTSNVVKV